MPRTLPAESTSNLRCAVLAAGAYVLAGALLTWPMMWSPGSALFADYGDARGIAWFLWAKTHGYFDGPLNTMIAAPFGIPASQVIAQPLSDALLLGLARATGEIAALNLFALVCLWTTAMATYAMCAALGLSRIASFFAGLAFGFCPAAVMQILGGHAPFAFNLFVPLFVLAMLRNREHRSLLTASAVAGSFAAICMSSLYMGYFALYIGLLFVAIDVVSARGESRRILRNYVQCAGIAMLILLPVEFAALREQLAAPREAVARAGHIRDFGELFVFSARLWNYAVPSIDHPLFGRYVEPFVRNNLHGSNAFEQTLYLGIAPFALMVTGVALVFRRAFPAREQRLFLLLATMALWMIFVSLPPNVGSGLPTPSYLAYAVAPMFRVYARAGIVVVFFVACAAAVVLTQLQRVLPARHFRLVAAASIIVLAFDYSSVTPGRMRTETMPEVYRWLASQPGPATVAEYPMVRFDEAAFYSYPFWQRIHHKAILNGASPDNPPAWDMYLRVKDLGNPDTPLLLRNAGVKYVVVHTAMYAEGPIPSGIKRYYSPERAAATSDGGKPPAIPPGLKLAARFGDDLVFATQE